MAAVALSLGCSWFVRTQGFAYDDVKRTPKASDHPIPILESPPVGRPHVVIGMVQADSGTADGIGDRELQEGLRKEARKMGGDALINLERRPTIHTPAAHRVDADVVDPTGRESMRYRWVADVISFDLPEEPPSP